MEWQHIYPQNDWIEHKLEGLDCICEPRIDWENMLVIHNSADGRENGEKKDMTERIKWPKEDDYKSKRCPHCQMMILDYREEDTNIKLYRLNIERGLFWGDAPRTLAKLFAMDEPSWRAIPGFGVKTVDYLKHIRAKMSYPVKVEKRDGKIITTYQIITND